MKSAKAFLQALEKGRSPEMALSSLPQYQPPFIAGIPFEIHWLALGLGWRFFPIWFPESPSRITKNFRQATNDPKQLQRWGRLSPAWALRTGFPGPLVVQVEGEIGRASLLALCGDNWDWLFTLRSMHGCERYLFFVSPRDGDFIPRSRLLGSGLRIHGNGSWVIIPPSPGHHYLSLPLTVMNVPEWLSSALERDPTTPTDHLEGVVASACALRYPLHL